MGEPTQGVPFFEWLGRNFGVMVTAIVAFIAGIFALSNRYKASVDKQLMDARTEIDTELSKVWSEMRNHISVQTVQGSDIAVLKNKQENTVDQLEDIKSATSETNRKLEGLSGMITTILLEVRRER